MPTPAAQAAELGATAASAPLNLAIAVPSGWRIETQQPIRYNFNGVCSGGKISLISPDELREEFELIPPLCKPKPESP